MDLKRIAMRCTQAEYDALLPKLQDIGYPIKRVTNTWEDDTYLTNIFNWELGIANIDKIEALGRRVYEEWDELLFLSLCVVGQEYLVLKRVNWNNIKTGSIVKTVGVDVFDNSKLANVVLYNANGSVSQHGFTYSKTPLTTLEQDGVFFTIDYPLHAITQVIKY